MLLGGKTMLQKVYCVSDIHGRHDKYKALIEKIQDTDTLLYVLGDVIDRGPDGVKILQDMMLRPNIVPILGNHELNAAACLPWLLEEITEESLAKLDEARLGALRDWMVNGGGSTLRALGKLSPEERENILDYLGEFSLYEEVKVNGRSFVLTHSGLWNFAPDKHLAEYTLEELLFCRPDQDTAYWPDRIVVHGHTPTRYLSGENKILRRETWIDIDCGCASGGPLGCLCLGTMEAFYI